MEATSMSINRVANQDDVVHIHTMEYYVAIKKNENNAMCRTWIDLEIVILCEVSHTQKDKYHMTSLIRGL